MEFMFSKIRLKCERVIFVLFMANGTCCMPKVVGERQMQRQRALYNAVVNRSHRRRNDYSNSSNIDEKFCNLLARGGLGKSFPQFSLSGTNAFGVGFSLWLRIWLETLWFMAFRHQNWQHVATASRRADSDADSDAESKPSCDIKTFG